MKAPRTVIYLICFYCLVSSVIFMALAVLAIMSFFCVFDFTGGPVRLMTYLLYFRRPECDAENFPWDVLGIRFNNEPRLPSTIAGAVLRTLILAIAYLALNLFLFLTIFRTMSGIRQNSRNKHIIFWSYFSPLLITFILIIALDFIAAAFYLVEFFMLWLSSDAIIDMVGITSDNEPDLNEGIGNIARNTRSLPSMIMFIATSKVLLLLTFNFALAYIYFIAAWKVCRENQKTVFKVTSLKKSKKKSEVTSKPVQGTTIHRVESSAAPERNQQTLVTVKKSEKVVKEKNKKKGDARRDETELPTIHHVETSTSNVAEEPKELQVSSVKKVEKVKKEKTPKPINYGPRDITELQEIQLPRITYQKQPSQEEIPLPPPPSFNNKRNHKTKI